MPLFIKPLDQYKRHSALMSQAITDNAKFLSVMTGYDNEYCKTWVRDAFRKNGSMPLDIPNITFTERQSNGDREERTVSLLRYIKDIEELGYLVSGTLTVYVPPRIKQSPFTTYIENKKKRRKAVKKEEQAAEMRKDTLKQNLCKAMQTTLKGKINSLSGAEMSDGNPFALPTAHPTLTVTCRITANYGDAVLDRFVRGNKHYHNPQVTLNAIVNITTMANIAAIEAVMDKYGLHYPTTDECFASVLYSSRLYWKDTLPGTPHESAIRGYIERCTPAERAAIMYVGDFYHLAMYNEAFCRNLILETMNPVGIVVDNPTETLQSMDPDILNFGIQRYCSEMAGIEVGKTLCNHPDLERRVAEVCVSMQTRFTALSDLIFALWATDVGPHSIAAYPDAVRRAIPGGDTDSAFVCCEFFVEWIYKTINFSDEAWGTAAIVAYMATSLVSHQLVQMAKNFGAEDSALRVIDMKNEFGFNMFIPSQASKHYIAGRTVKDGNVLPECVLEQKGVTLISEDAPEEIVQGAIKMNKYILKTIEKTGKISLIELIKMVAVIEKRIINSIMSGDSFFFRNIRVNDPNAYKNGEANATYRGHLFWNNTFGKHAGMDVTPTYIAKSISVDLNSATKVKDWLDDFDDKELAKIVMDFMEANDMTKGLSTVRIPEAYLAEHPIPPDIAKAAKVRQVVQKLMTRYYLILEQFGYYAFEKRVGMLVSDTY